MAEGEDLSLMEEDKVTGGPGSRRKQGGEGAMCPPLTSASCSTEPLLEAGRGAVGCCF